MKQKIVITASMSREAAPIAPEITYQWHWQRIATVILFVTCALIIFTYSLLSSVNAEQNDQQQALDSSTVAVAQTSEEDTPLVSSTPIADNTEFERVSEPSMLTALSADGNSTSIEDDKSESLKMAMLTDSLEQQIIASNQSEHSQALAANAIDITNTNNNEPVESDDSAEQPDGFASSAHIANVALGAKIDTDKVSRAVLTRAVVDREPVNVFKADVRLNEFTATMAFFSELKNMQGQTVKHVWRYENKVLASIELGVTSPRYRTYSNKTILPEQVGNWRVDVIDEQGHLLAQKEFRILAE
ncbi:DUF2914 domain-containing protein [Pseudoalteromonas arctica]|uniref:DUF2914 domain-containing protein n=1 Tax=Pseudoalteromonas arctica TaxID=394751 RepID=A0A7Y0DT73_9GAMM|nr:DUF2914 domain-containing protein [Pseudoalteromonas arctica]NMM41096.1 DUF2914 domain-containing protein [Pseudoalteromonas arctica]